MFRRIGRCATTGAGGVFRLSLGGGKGLRNSKRDLFEMSVPLYSANSSFPEAKEVGKEDTPIDDDPVAEESVALKSVLSEMVGGKPLAERSIPAAPRSSEAEAEDEEDGDGGEARPVAKPSEKTSSGKGAGDGDANVRRIKPTVMKKMLNFDSESTRNFIVRELLQRVKVNSTATEIKVSGLIQELSRKWKVETRPMDGMSRDALLRLLGQFSLGERRLPLETLELLDYVFVERLGIFQGSLKDQHQMRALLDWIGYAKPSDNLHRIVASHQILLRPEAVKFAEEMFPGEGIEVDPYDALRENTPHNVYAIDSATTSEVDDAIGIHIDPKTGLEWITVFVSDATVYCPFDSDLEKSSARALTTTTYLPEGVYFMLPEKTVKAATLREDRPCRTFEARFRLDENTGQILDYYVTVGWCHNLRRITYDATQSLYDDKKSAERTGTPYENRILSDTPSWATVNDVAILHRIHHYARKRLEERMKQPRGVSANLPQPLVKVKGTSVLSVEDQILCTIDARVAVAELMIAANEVCSRVAQEIDEPIPFRGSRPLSPVHEANVEYRPPLGLLTLPSTPLASSSSSPQQLSTAFSPSNGGPANNSSLAEAIFRDIESLRGVTRAFYSHEPVYHNGLNTANYCHSTSPLRRYADMLVHHQLKTAIGRQQDIKVQEFIPNFQMAELCQLCSDVGNRNRLMQQKSVRFWVLRHLRDNVLPKEAPGFKLAEVQGNTAGPGNSALGLSTGVVLQDGGYRLKCLVGQSTDISSTAFIRQVQRQRGSLPRFTISSDIYIPELQLTHTVLHSNPDVRAGSVVWCKILRLDPMLDVLQLEVDRVSAAEDTTETMSKLAVALGSEE
jgi:hypothetical protein